MSGQAKMMDVDRDNFVYLKDKISLHFKTCLKYVNLGS